MIIQILNTYDNSRLMSDIRNKLLTVLSRYSKDCLFVYDKYLISYDKLKIDCSGSNNDIRFGYFKIIFSECPILNRLKSNKIPLNDKIIIEFSNEFLEGCEHYIPIKFTNSNGVTLHKIYNSKFETLEIDDLINILNREISFYILDEE